MFLVSKVTEGVKVLMVPSVFAVVADEPLALRVTARGLMPSEAWVSRVSPAASKILASPGVFGPELVVTTV